MSLNRGLMLGGIAGALILAGLAAWGWASGHIPLMLGHMAAEHERNHPTHLATSRISHSGARTGPGHAGGLGSAGRFGSGGSARGGYGHTAYGHGRAFGHSGGYGHSSYSHGVGFGRSSGFGRSASGTGIGKTGFGPAGRSSGFARSSGGGSSGFSHGRSSGFGRTSGDGSGGFGRSSGSGGFGHSSGNVFGGGGFGNRSGGFANSHGFEDTPFLPWPPLTPSSRGDITSWAVRPHDVFGDVDRRLIALLLRSGYSNRYYFSVPDGFALLTPLEHVTADGAGLPESSRWSLAKETAHWSWVDYIKKLFSGPDGRYRMFLFIVTPAYYGTTDDVAGGHDVERWLRTGRDILNPALAAQTLPPGITVHVFVYEFSIDKGRMAMDSDRMKALRQNTTEALPFPVHMRALRFR